MSLRDETRRSFHYTARSAAGARRGRWSPSLYDADDALICRRRSRCESAENALGKERMARDTFSFWSYALQLPLCSCPVSAFSLLRA